jgi:hypothetical protein
MVKEFSRRANRGNRMQALVNKAQDEEDDEFWGGIGAQLFGGSISKKKTQKGEEEEEEGAEGFEDESDGEFDIQSASDSGDSFDSDFGKSSQEENGESDREEAKSKKGAKRVRFRGEEKDEDELLELEEKRAASKRKTLAQKQLGVKKQLQAGVGNKRQQK